MRAQDSFVLEDLKTMSPGLRGPATTVPQLLSPPFLRWILFHGPMWPPC